MEQYEQYVANNMEQESLNNTNPQLERQLQDLQAQIDDSKEAGTAPQANFCKTMVVGGFGGISSLHKVMVVECTTAAVAVSKIHRNWHENTIVSSILRSEGLTNGDHKV